MADPLSIASGVAGLLSLGIQTTGALVKYYDSYKDRDAKVARITQRLEILQTVIQALETALQQRKFQADERPLIDQIVSSVQSCEESIQELNEECEKLIKTSCGSFKGAIKAVGRRTAYPFRESTLKKLEEDVGEIRGHLSLALDALHLRDNRTTQDGLVGIKSAVALVGAVQISSTIRDWFKAPDVDVDHNAALAKRHPGTGVWLLEAAAFHNWLSQTNSFLWLHGFAGCGKSVLCSTIIEHTIQQRRGANIGVAFFYFTFSDETKQDQSAMLRALIWQLISQLPDFLQLQRLHSSYETGLPPPAVLSEQLQTCIQRFDRVYILIDSLDESPRGTQRDRVLERVAAMRKWLTPGLHLLVTSRDELDIRDSLNTNPTEEILLKNDDIDRDIRTFISEKLSTDSKLRAKWQSQHQRIQEALAERAQGVYVGGKQVKEQLLIIIRFRWVECQFEALTKCPRSDYHLDRCLQSLPRSLDETYERMLLSIDKECYEEARRILTLLCFSSRPLKVAEVLHGIAVDLSDQGGLRKSRVLQGADDLREVCPGMIDFGPQPENDINSTANTPRNEEIVRIAHFSVQEYLESDRIRQGKARFFAMSSTCAHQEIATVCCAYLLEPQLHDGPLNPAKLVEFPFAQFAAQFWFHHYYHTRNEVPTQLETLITNMFTLEHEKFATWVKIYDPLDFPWKAGVEFERNANDVASALYYASFFGFLEIVQILLHQKGAAGRKDEDIANTQGRFYGTALQAASARGHAAIVKLLIDNGADINVQAALQGNALRAASAEGFAEIVKLLIDKGAEVNAQAGHDKNALQASSVGGHVDVVKLLIDGGADVNAQGGHYGNALQAASARGHVKVVRLLIDGGADVNAQGGHYGNALRAASARGLLEIVKSLIDKGAEVNTPGEDYGNALEAASQEGHFEVVKLLVENGAEINAQGGSFGSALQAASAGGNVEIVKLLIEKGAEINVQGGRYGSAIQAASAHGYVEIVRLLVDKYAEINAASGRHGSGSNP